MGSAVDELCALSAVEARRRIGTKELSPVELLEACIARIEQGTRQRGYGDGLRAGA
jgi:Asp-tRNA(Asn)/Glu-tRNA(Gln) amidotransferase A subunit family amidase